MPGSLIVWMLTALLILGVLTDRWWEPYLQARGFNVRSWPWKWWLLGYPKLAMRIWWTWRRLCRLNGLSVSWADDQRLIGRDLVVQGRSLRQKSPRLGWPTPTRHGLTLRVILHPGQTPAPFYAAAQAMEHAWRVFSVRITSPRKGQVLVSMTILDPLTGKRPATSRDAAPALLTADVGTEEEGNPWLVNFRKVPHWLVTGATQSGKSSFLAALVRSLAPQPISLIGIDCKGGMELGLFAPRLERLATNRKQALDVLTAVIQEIERRMVRCREAAARSIWEIAETERPTPVVLIVDELAELYLTDGSRESRDEAEQCGTLLLRVAQLGAALGVYLVLAGQRVGSDLGPRVTALRAQLGGRIAHRAHDEASAEMTLGDIHGDAVIVAQTITEDEQGIAVVASGGRWLRARSHLVSSADVATIAATAAPWSALEPPSIAKTGGGV